jgi:hypothetical protein
MNNEWGRMWTEAVWPNLSYNPGICLAQESTITESSKILIKHLPYARQKRYCLIQVFSSVFIGCSVTLFQPGRWLRSVVGREYICTSISVILFDFVLHLDCGLTVYDTV